MIGGGEGEGNERATESCFRMVDVGSGDQGIADWNPHLGEPKNFLWQPET